ncbi:MAG: hypothetical protein LBT32_07435, partial [Peptococcaceae bacterium]|nr:hypothetical protein [Peptococcaceae bacterium]
NKASVHVERRSAIAIAPPTSSDTPDPAKTVATNAATKLDNAIKKTIRGLVKDEKLSPGHYNGIYKLFMNESDKQALYTGLVRLFAQKQGSYLYNLLKDEFEQYRAG